MVESITAIVNFHWKNQLSQILGKVLGSFSHEIQELTNIPNNLKVLEFKGQLEPMSLDFKQTCL